MQSPQRYFERKCRLEPGPEIDPPRRRHLAKQPVLRGRQSSTDPRRPGSPRAFVDRRQPQEATTGPSVRGNPCQAWSRKLRRFGLTETWNSHFLTDINVWLRPEVDVARHSYL
jgi:hypothetical protein